MPKRVSERHFFERDQSMTGEAELAERLPHDVFRQDLLLRIDNLSPSSLLDVGCGTGKLLLDAGQMGCGKCVGVEVNSEDAAMLRAGGLDVHHAPAEMLPFEDGSFDIVVMQYVAHHVQDLAEALREAVRVARRAILILDGWYDLALPSQKVAHDFDLWSKKVDRAAGEFHNPCPHASQLAQLILSHGKFEIDYQHRLLLRPVPISEIQDHAISQLAKVDGLATLDDELAAILARAKRDGLSEEGALLFSAIRPPIAFNSGAHDKPATHHFQPS